jgi:hypothetical protein
MMSRGVASFSATFAVTFRLFLFPITRRRHPLAIRRFLLHLQN